MSSANFCFYVLPVTFPHRRELRNTSKIVGVVERVTVLASEVAARSLATGRYPKLAPAPMNGVQWPPLI